jgi:hypothetical protein
LLWLNAIGLDLRASTIVLALATLAAGVWTWRMRPGLALSFHLSRQLLIWLLLAALGITLLCVLIIAVGQPLHYWDSWTIWGFKARTIFLEQRISPALYSDPSHAITHPDYPLRVPLVEAWLYQWLGAPDDRLAGLLALGDYTALIAISYGYLLRNGLSTQRALLAAAVIGTMPALALLAAEVYADVPLALYALIAACYLYEWSERGKRGALYVGAMGAGFLPWTKREGWILLAAILFALLVVSFAARNRDRMRRAFFGALAGGLAPAVIAAPWYVFTLREGVSSTDFLPLTLATLGANLDRIPTIARVILGDLLNPEWSFVIPLALAVLLILIWRGRERAPLVFFLLAALLYIVAISFLFVWSAFTPFVSHVLSAGYRLIAQVLPLAVIALGITIARDQEPAR